MNDLFPSVNLERRVFVKGIGLVSAGLVLGTFGGCEKWLKQIKNRPIRRRLRVGSAAVDADIATYREAVKLMKALSVGNPSDPRGWNSQAAIHGTAGVGFNFCHHGTQHFFSWHRAYLFWFEKICQKLTGNAKFGLPYWNWNQNPDINPAFLDATSPLFVARNNTSVTGFSSTTTPALDPIFGDANFFTFSSQIEGTPHNSVHGIVGGIMGGFGSAQDPVFWTHHCMVDYCWAKWNIDLNNNNTNNPAWGNTAWNHFTDADGNPATTAAGLTTIMPLLSYQYESSAIGSSSQVLDISAARDFRRLEKRIKEGADVKFEIQQRIPVSESALVGISRPFSIETKMVPSEFSRIISGDMANEKIFASIQYASLPPSSDFFVRVFINLPQASRDTPIEDRHYAGSFAFFGTEPTDPAHQSHRPEHKHQPTFLVNVTDTLQRLKKDQELSDKTPISVQLVAVPYSDRFEKEETQLRLEKLELIVTPVQIKAK